MAYRSRSSAFSGDPDASTSSVYNTTRTDAITEEVVEPPTDYRPRSNAFINDLYNVWDNEFRRRSNAFSEQMNRPDPRPPIPTPTPIKTPSRPITPPPIIPTREYLDYIKKLATDAGKESYKHTRGGIRDPLSDMRSRHRRYGIDTRYSNRRLYPRPKYPIDDYNFPTTTRGERACYGQYNDLPLHGPAEWHHYYTDWSIVGDQYADPIPTDVPLPTEELVYIESHGFTFKELLGHGGYAKVWKVTAERLIKDDQGNYVEVDMACKILSLIKFHEPGSDVRSAVDSLLHEAQLHVSLKHPNIVKSEHLFYVHDITTGFPFCRCIQLMELCDGDLKKYLGDHPNKKLNENEARNAFQDYASGLQYLHHKNIVHLDLKIHNVMYRQTPQLTFKLGDFGVSKKYDPQTVGQVFGTVGTRLYAAPEVIGLTQKMSLSKPIDIFTLGLVLTETLSGRAKARQLVKAIRDNEGQTHDNVNQVWSISQQVSQLILWMTRVDPQQRPDIDQVFNHPWVGQQT